MKKAKSKWKIIVAVVIVLLLVAAVIGWGFLSVSIYKENFDRRFASYEPMMLSLDDYDGLSREQYEFQSDKGQILTGYYYTSFWDPVGIIVIAHGMGAGHNSYMDIADFFVQNGYAVFAYDATGCGESGGESLGGVPQGAIDLDYAISFVEESGNFPELPILLFGHSWGGYSACSVLSYHPEVKAVVECAGCNRSSDLFEAGGKEQAGSVIYTMMPFVKLYERMQFGKYAANTALDGFAASNAKVMVVHSADDGVVPISYGLDLYEKHYADDPRFTFLRLENRGHNYVFDDTSYVDAFEQELQKWRSTLGYDPDAEENKARYAEDKAEYIRQNLNRTEWSHMVDSAMAMQFVEFYDEAIGRWSE